MRPLRVLIPVVALGLAACWTGARADVRVLQSDATGVTLRVDVPAWTLEPGTANRVRIAAGGMKAAGPPGRARLPFYSTLLALPPGARAEARVIASDPEEMREGVALEIVPEPGFRNDAAGLGVVPVLEEAEAITDGPWPRSAVEVGAPFVLRRDRLATLRVTPFRWDAETGQLWSRRSVTVRVDFTGGAGTSAFGTDSPDRHWDPVLREAVLNFDRAGAWRTPPAEARPSRGLLEGTAAGAGVQAFDEDELEVRVQLDTTGVYALEFDRLAAAGYPSGVPVAEVSVHRHEFLENAAPSYATIELPIEVDDRDGSGTFNTGDRILVFVQSWAERSRASMAQRAWGDGEVVYATRLTGRAGLRLPSRAGWRDLLLSPLPSYPRSERWEKNVTYMSAYYIPAGADTNVDQFQWTGLLQYANADSFEFRVHDPDTTHAVRVTVGWQGRKHNSHVTWANMRNGRNQFTSIADSVVWFGRGALAVTRVMNGSAFSPGRNVVRSWGKTSETENVIVNVGFNWFDTEYWRAYRALNGYLPCNSGETVGDYQIEARGFTTRSIEVWDVTDSLAPVRLALADTLITADGAGFKVRFQDTSPTGERRSYLAFDRARTLDASRYQAVPQPRRALHASGAGDYLLIVPEVFLDAVQPLADLREAQGLRVVVAPLETVNDEFNGGRKSTYSIRRFARYAMNNWGARFVTLVGDGSEDPQNFMGSSGIDWVPCQKIPGPVGVSDGASSILEPIPSDNWLVWCLNCPSPNLGERVPDMYIGRLPVNSAAEAADVVKKLVDYESPAADPLWRRRMFILADDKFSTTSFFGGGNPGSPTYCQRNYEGIFLDISKAVQDVVIDRAGLRESEVEVYNLQYELRNEPITVSGSDTCRVDWNDTQSRAHLAITPQIIQRLNQGRLWWNYQGHANQYVLTHEDIWVNRGLNDDHLLLANDGMPFFFSAFSCHPNGFAVTNERLSNRGPSIGEELVTSPRGAIASWASSGYEILPSTAATHLNTLLADALFSNPPQDEVLGDRGARVVLGEAIALCLLRNLDTAFFVLERNVGMSYILLGDPATRLSIGPSQFTVTANGQPVANGEPVRLFTFGDSLKLEADVASNVRIDSIWVERTDVTGTRVIPDTSYTLSPSFPDTAAGGSGGRRYLLRYGTTLEVGSYRYTIRTLDRWGVQGRFDVVFQFQSVLRSGGATVLDGDAVPSGADLSLLVISPGTLTAGDFSLEVDGAAQAITAVPASGDTTGRQWVIGWDHAPYAAGEHRVVLTVTGGVTVEHVFTVEPGTRLDNVLAFPNPFEDDLGVTFSFGLVSDGPADVLLRVYTVSGRMIYERKERGMQPTYHQITWDGRDAEGQKLANGVYFYRLLAHSGSARVMHEGRLVKLRKPRRGTEDDSGS